jgi:hypothetical protein
MSLPVSFNLKVFMKNYEARPIFIALLVGAINGYLVVRVGTTAGLVFLGIFCAASLLYRALSWKRNKS